MSSKAKFEGTCQGRGSFQKLPDGRLSNHGYTVDWGFFQGTCRGSKELPFEQDFLLIHKFINEVTKDIENLVTKRDEVLQSTDNKNVYRNIHSSGQHTWEQREIIVEEIPYSSGGGSYFKFEWFYSDEEIEKLKKTHRYGYKHLLEAGAHGHHKSLEDCVKAQNKRYADYLTAQIQKNQSYIEWQQERIKNWKPKELTPIEKKHTGPKVHLVNAYDIRIEDGKVKYKGRRDSACGRSSSFLKISEFEKNYKENPDSCCKGCTKRFLELKEVIKQRKKEA